MICERHNDLYSSPTRSPLFPSEAKALELGGDVFRRELPPRVAGFRPSSGVVGKKLEMRADDIGIHGTQATRLAGESAVVCCAPAIRSEKRESENGGGDTHGVPRAETVEGDIRLTSHQ